ncbi:MAG: amidohydrolase family protein [Actinomycetes bacterium]
METGPTLLLHGAPIYVRMGVPPVEALAIRDGRVVAAGSLVEVERAAGEHRETRLLDGGAVLPAFIDAHQHAYLVAADPNTDVLYRKATDVAGLLAEIGGLIAAQGTDAQEGWLRFHGYEPMMLAEHRSPTAAELDAIAPDRPLHVLSRTFHESVVNTLGLELLGIDRSPQDPPGGRIVRDRRGNPTGVLLEAASFDAEAASRPDEDVDGWRERLKAHGRLLLRHGIVRIGDAAVPQHAAGMLVSDLAEIGVEAHPLLVGARIDEPAFVDGGTAKVLADGGEYCHLCLTSSQVRTLMRESLKANLGPDRSLARAVGRRAGFPKREADGRWHTGIRYSAEGRLPALLAAAAEAGSGLAVHAIGNGSIEAVLAAAALPASHRPTALRIEHAMTVSPELARQIGHAGIPVVAQPGFLAAFGHELTSVPLPDPLQLMPYRTLLDADVSITFSSDYPAADINPWAGIAAAVSRRDRFGKVIDPQQAVTLSEAVTAYTLEAARVLHLGDVGTLEEGMSADLVWWDRDPHGVGSSEWSTLTARQTWSAGRLVYEA